MPSHKKPSPRTFRTVGIKVRLISVVVNIDASIVPRLTIPDRSSKRLGSCCTNISPSGFEPMFAEYVCARFFICSKRELEFGISHKGSFPTDVEILRFVKLTAEETRTHAT